MFEALDEFDRKVAQEVGTVFPDWLALATVEEIEGERAFVVSVEPPSQNVTYPLRVDTCGGEVTVSFEYYHAHFYEFCDGTDQDAVSLIRQITSGKYAAVSYWRDDQWCGSALLEASKLPSNNNEYPYANRIHLRSWTGTLDNDIACTPRG